MYTARFKKMVFGLPASAMLKALRAGIRYSVFGKQLARFGRWSTKTPKRKAAWVLLVSFLINQFIYPYIPFLAPKGVHANGTIESVSFGTSLFVNKNPDFNVWFGDRFDETKHKIVFEVDGKEIEMRLQDLRSQILDVSSPSGDLAFVNQTLNEVNQIVTDVSKDLKKPILTTSQTKDGMVDAIEQKVGDAAKIKYEILPNRGVKESILISDQSSVTSNQYVFSMKLSGGVQLKSKLENLNDIKLNTENRVPSTEYHFEDSKGKYLANFEPLIMTDAAGAMSNDIEMSITPTSCLLVTCYSVTITANESWLSDPLRVYPVNLDPTIVHEQNPDFSSGTENRTQVTGTGIVETEFKELQTDINTVGLWHFNEGSSTTAYDASGNSKNGTLTNGPVWNGPTDTLVGLGKSSLSLDNSDDYVAVGALTSSAVVKTVEFWVYPKSTSTEFIDLNASAYINVSSGTIGTTGFTSPTVYVNGIVSSTVVASQWQHIAVTTETALNASATNFGKRSTSYLNGYLDEVRISNKARTPEEIAASASRYPYAVHESPVIDFGATPNTLDSLTYTGTGIRTGDGETPYSRDGLIAQWNFNETSGTTAYNMAGNDSCGGTSSSCNLTLNNFASTSSQDQAAGTGWTANDRRWGAGAINISSVATADTISLSNPSTLDPNSSDLSVETWVKTTDVTAELFSNNSANGVSCTSDGYYLGIDASGYPVFTLDTDGATAGCDATITTGITKKVNDGIWHHLAATVTNGSAAYLYMDGVIIGSDTSITAYASEAPSGNVLVGSTNNFDGTLEALRFYSRALTATEVLANAQVGNIEFQTRTGATSTPNDGTWETWRTTSGTGDTQINAMDATTGWAWDGNASDPTSVALDTTTKIEGSGSLKNIIGMPEADANTVALWHMDETSGTGAYIKDSTANANNGTPTGTTVVDGFYGKGRSFNGSSDYIDVPDSANWAFGTGDFAISAWVKFTDIATHRAIIGQRQDATNFMGLYWSQTASVLYFHAIDSGVWRADYNFGWTPTPNSWYHIEVARQGTNFNMYLNGVAQSLTTTTAISTNSIGNISAPLGIGLAELQYMKGSIDEVRVGNTTRTAEEVAEAYRAGRDHRLSKTITATDLSAKTKLPFYVASDRPGTFMEATVGESAYANYEPDANTVGLWRLEEAAGSGAYIKDSSGNGFNGTPTNGPTFVQGKIGKARNFDGTDDYITVADNNSLTATSKTLDAWVKLNTLGTNDLIAGKAEEEWLAYNATVVNCAANKFGFAVANTTPTWVCVSSATTPVVDQWYHLVGTYDGTNIRLYVNGVLEGGPTAQTTSPNSTAPFDIGSYSSGTASYSSAAQIDEVRLSNINRSADEIRQAYEIGKRTHTITNDFVTNPQAAYTSGTSVTINNPSGTTNLTDTLAKGDTIIFKENVNGTETVSQSLVSNIVNTSSTYGTVTVLAAPTFPSGGYTTAAKVFKWQREYMDLTQITQSTHRDAMTRITMRVTDGSQGANVWIDDFESADYSDGARVTIGSTAQRYFQYRTILTSPTTQTSPTLTNVNINYNSGTTAQAPKTKDASTDFTATGASLNRITDTGSSNSPSLELAYKELPADINTLGLYHFSSGACATDSSGNSFTLTANGGMTCATGGKFGYTASGFATTPVSYSHATILDLALTSGTIEAWINPANLTGTQTILYADSTSDTLLTLGSSGQINFSTSASTNLATANSLIAAGSWYHIAASWTAAGHKIYINGVEVASDTNTTTHTNQDYITYVGVGSGGNTNVFSSLIDELRISNIARTPEEIKLDAQRRPYGVYTSDPIKLPSNVSSLDNLRWTENGVQTGDGETPYSTNGLVAQWNFNETNGTTATNSTNSSCGSTCNGTLTSFASTSSQDQAAGTGWTKDNRRWGAGAINISSAVTADTITVSDPAGNTLDPNSSDLTIGMWVKTQDVTAELLSNNANNGTACTANGYYLGIDASGYPNFYLDTNGITAGCDAQISALATGKINDGAWHYLSVSVTRGVSALMYLDGVQIGSDTSVTSYSSITVTGNVQIASNANYDGALDNIQVYSRALSATEIQSNYNNGNIEFQTRTGATSTPNDGTWEAWKPSGTSTEVQLDNKETLSPVQKINTTNLVGYWKLDEVSGNRADSVGSNTLTDNNTVTSKAGHLNLAGQFTAANSEYLSIADNAALSSGDIDLTVSAWAYLDTKSSAMYIVSKATNSSIAEYDLYYDNATDRFTFRIRNSSGTGVGTVTADALGTVSTGTWYLVTGWHDATANTVNITINNGSINSAATTGVLSDTTGLFQIGASETGIATWNGRIDEVAMWKRVLTADERRILYEDGLDKTNDSVVGGINRTSDTTTKFEGAGSEKLSIGAPQVDSSTVALWHMDETSGSGAYIKDSTANANNGTPTGTTVVDGFYGKGRSFNGSSDEINIGSGSSINITSVLSISGWIKRNESCGGNTPIILAGATNGYAFYPHSTNCKITFGKVGINEVSGNSTITDTNWHHVAVTTDGSNARFYLDGLADTANPVAYTSTFSTGLTYFIGSTNGGNYFKGTIDELKVDNVTRSADEIAESYRAGRDHRISTTISASDLSAKTKLPFYVASDRPGTFMEATVGESAFANYEPDANTVSQWHLDEQTGTSGTYIKDSSGNSRNSTSISGTTFIQGKVGKARDFSGSNVIHFGNILNGLGTTGLTVDTWIKTTTTVLNTGIVAKYYTTGGSFALRTDTTTAGKVEFTTMNGTSGTNDSVSVKSINDGNWHHIAGVLIPNVRQYLYVDGVLEDSDPATTGTWTDNHYVCVGTYCDSADSAYATSFTGTIDEVRVSNITRTADEIRQAYEIGKRTHQITNDFVTNPQAAYTSGTSVTINNPYGTTNLTDTLSIGETMIFKENVNGTETVSQAVVTNIVNTSSVYGTVTLLTAPTFPSGGYSTNAKVFKWQREYLDLGSSILGHRDAINRITLRVTDGSQGANVWLDDFTAAGPYLSNPTTRSSTIASTPNTYIQYRAIISTIDTAVSPTLTAISLQFHTQPRKVTGSDTLGAQGSLDRDGNVHLGSNNVKKVAFYDRTKDQISYALDFDGTNDYVAVGTGPTSVKTVEFWVNPNSTSTEFIDLNGSAYINVASGTIGTTGFTSPTVYVDGVVSSTVVANKWQHIAVTTGTGLNATALNFGKRSTSYFNGQMDEVALYSSALTASQVTTDYNNRRLAGTESGLVALYHFDEGLGTRAYDSTGGFHGTLTNMAATAWVNSQNDRDQSALSQQTIGVDPNWGNGVSRESYAVNFDGSDDHVDVGTSSTLRLTGNQTIEAWVKTNSLSAAQAVVGNGDTSGSNGYSYLIQIGTNGKIGYDSNRGGASPATSIGAISTGIWYHIAITFSPSTDAFKYYINGMLDSSVTNTDNPVANSSCSGIIGRRLDAGCSNFTTPFNGSIDEVSIFNTIRTSAEISSDYNARRLKGNETGLVALYHFDEGADNLCSGGTNDVCDATTNGLDGANTNGPTWVTDARAVMDNNARYISLAASSTVTSDKGVEIYAISTTQFKYRWTGDQTWSSAVNFSSYPFATPAQLGTTGVYVGFDTTNGVFGDESYFLIPSWAIQQFSANRGTRRSFPERSYLVATDRSVDIIDADDNTLWMRTSNGVANNLLGTQTLNVPSSVAMSNGQLLIGTNGSSGTGAYRLDFNRDVAYRYNATNRTNGTNNLAKRNATDWSWGSADTGQNLIDSIVNDVSLLLINGKCVAGDTLLRRRRRKNGKWIYDDVRIDGVEIGDEILSLNEKTGKFEWQIVEAKKLMGVKPTWQIITESGKKIRATEDHKFLSSITHSRSGTFEVDQSNRIEDRTKDTYIAITGHGFTNITIVKAEIKRAVYDKYYKNRQKLFGPMMWARVINHLLIQSEIQNAKIVLDIEYSNYNKLIEQIVTNGVKNISVEFKSIGKESPAHIAVWTANRKARKTTGASGITQTAKDVLHPEFTGIRTSSSRNLSGDYQNLTKKSSPVWTETTDLASNCWIATESGWEKIKVVYKVARETVWDIRVSGNHNFVGNELVAHNCMLATANNTGLTKIANIMSNDTSYDYSDVTSNAYNRVKLAENYVSGTGAVGDLYALNSTNNALERWNNVVADSASETNGIPDATVNATSTPALFASAQTVNDLDIKTGTSLANSGNNTVFVGHNGGTTVFQEHRATLASSSVKYYTKDYIGEEMVGDIRGSWSLNGLTDNSLKAQTLTNNGSTTFTTSSVRGLAPTLNGSSQYLSVADNANFSITGALTIAAWIYPTSLAGDKVVIAKWGSNQQSYLLYIPSSTNKLNLLISSSGSGWTTAAGNTALQTNQWYFVSATFTPGSKMEVFVNGVSDGSNTTSIPASIYDSTPGLGIGFDIPNGVAGEYFAGIIDEPFVTATTLSAAQIQQMYVVGKEALNNKYRVKLASDTVNQLAGTINVVKGVAASDQYIFAGTNTTGADDGILSRVLLRGDVTDKTYDESTTDPVIVDNDINSVAVSKDGAYIIVGTDDQGITIIHNGVEGNRLRSGAKVQGPSKRPSN